MGLQTELCLLSFFMTVAGVLGGDLCYNINDSPRWCTYGCCGYLDRECCDANVALIVGLCVMGVLVVSTIIAVVCCCMRRRAAAGQVLNTSPGAGPGLVVTTGQTTMSAGQPMQYPQQGYQPYPGQQPYPMGQQPYPMGQPAPQPYGAPGAMAPPPYSQATGGIVNAGYDQKN